MELTLKGKTAFVTGSTRGIGYAIAFLLAEQGARVIFNGRSATHVEMAVANCRAKGFLAEGFPGNAHDEQFVEYLRDFVDRLGCTIDIFVGNADSAENVALKELTISRWKEEVNKPLTATFLVVQYVVDSMKQKRQGKIIFISSLSGVAGRDKGTHYVTKKAALIGMAKALAYELGPFGIQVNAIAPGLTHTDLLYKTHSDDMLRVAARNIPMRRIANPVDIAKVALFLASSLSDYVSGQTIIVNGGMGISL